MAPLPISPAAPATAPGSIAAARPSFRAALRLAERAAPPCAAPPAPRAAQAALATVERARERLDAVLAAARRGRTFTPQELLALQSDAYRYAQTVDVAARIVEQGAQAVRQAVQTQV